MKGLFVPMRMIIWMIYFWLYMLRTIPWIYTARRLQRRGETEKLDAFLLKRVTDWARRLLRLAGARITVSGQENIPQGAVVFISNHQGNFDIPLMLSTCGRLVGFVSKIEIKKLPIVRSWMEFIHCVFINRSNPREAMMLLLRDSVKTLQEGYSLHISPEGTRSRGGPVARFKYGGFKMAITADVPIVPVMIDGTYHIMEEHHGWIHSGDVAIRYLPPIYPGKLTKEEQGVLHETVRQQIIDAMEESRNPEVEWKGRI